MLRMLALILALIVVVFVTASVVKTFFWLALLALIAGAVVLAVSFFRLGRHSTGRSRRRF
jgi:MFS superfamily sulfate permease-like transporter